MMSDNSAGRGEARYQLAVTLYVFRWNRPGLPGRKGQTVPLAGAFTPNE